MLSVESPRGFTMIELLVAMAILALLLALGVPAMGTYLQNSKLGAATSSLYSALQTARTEAIRSNSVAQLVLTDTPVATSNIANAATPGVTGRNFVVRAASGPTFRLVEARSGAESEGGATAAAIVIAAAASGVAGFDGTIQFNAFGAAGATYRIDISNPVAGTCAETGGPIRCRRIIVSPGGQVTACDPAAAAGDSRAC